MRDPPPGRCPGDVSWTIRWLAEPFCDEELRADIVTAVEHLDEIPVAEFTALLGAASSTAQRPRSKPRF